MGRHKKTPKSDPKWDPKVAKITKILTREDPKITKIAKKTSFLRGQFFDDFRDSRKIGKRGPDQRIQ